MNTSTLMKQPSAFLPVAMSLAALIVVLGAVVVFGAVQLQEAQDEGALAHIWHRMDATANAPVS